MKKSVRPLKNAYELRGLGPELAEDLDALFPERCPRPNQTEREIWMYAGKRELVCALRRLAENQEQALAEATYGPQRLAPL